MVTFGIKPTRPETGYGYLELSTDLVDGHGTSDLKQFIEKPNLQHVKQMLGADHTLERSDIPVPRSGCGQRLQGLRPRNT